MGRTSCLRGALKRTLSSSRLGALSRILLRIPGSMRKKSRSNDFHSLARLMITSSNFWSIARGATTSEMVWRATASGAADPRAPRGTVREISREVSDGDEIA